MLRERIVGFEPRRGDRDFQQRHQVTPTRLCFNARGHDRLTSVRDYDNVPGFKVRRRVLQEAEVVAGRVMESVGRHGAPSIEKLAAL
jgi:hypothetical protein